LIATFFAEQQPFWLSGPFVFLENWTVDQTALKEGYYGNYSMTNTED